ncbi:MAG TPA: MraY family glycosyltransferase [Solirubrobacteraceae bacterium]|jgi:UDP-GlcNAc:undecaprenyl-phosphate GlcNAc-1-phosphate transferase|nr:MraY family glycosyltransferase [Solirubrobacteraceae bacterium]
MHAAVAGVVAAIATYLLTPLAIQVAGRLRFFDLPAGYKGHRQPTPYLGGSAIVVGLLVGVAAGGLHRHYVLVVACVVAVWLMGTIDDKLNLPILLRIAVEVAVGVTLALNGLGWQVFHIGVLNDLLTVLWVLGVMNAFNLMDNMDGAAATTAAASALGAAVIALLSDQRGGATVCLATAGACVGFLPRNLANPARIFMGDGGSLPLGLLVAAMAMNSVTQEYLGPKGVIIGALLVGLVIFDTTLVTVSRSRGGRSIFTGGRDHTTHRLRRRLGTPRNVAVTLAVTQLLLCAITISVAQAGSGWALVAGGVAVLFGLALMWQFETSPRFRPELVVSGSAAGDQGVTVGDLGPEQALSPAPRKLAVP